MASTTAAEHHAPLAAPDNGEVEAVPRARGRGAALMWLAVPLLAVAAYAPVARMWFVADDFGHLLFHRSLAFPKALYAFDAENMFYRPLSTVLTWNLGHALFGTNALPYHLMSLAAHALAALLLARAVATISGSSRTGWLAGALFAVYPLCTEPVAWLASQWDLLAAVGAFGAVWGFAAAWKRRDPRPYLGGLFAAFVAVGMKESALPLLAVLPFVALAAELTPRVSAGTGAARPPDGWGRFLGRAALWTLPYAVPSLAFVAVRLIAAGQLGGYPGARTNVLDFAWDSMVSSVLMALSPLNRLVFARPFVQAFAALATVLLLAGLVAFGRRRWPMLLLGAVWWVAFVAPALNIISPTPSGDNVTNRVLYLSMGGLCLAAASLADALAEMRAGRRILPVAAGLALVALVPITWLQLRPWVQASEQSRHLVQEAGRTLPPVTNRWIKFNVAELPREWKGAYLFWNGFDSAMTGFYNILPRMNNVDAAADLRPEWVAQTDEGTDGTYNIAIGLDSATGTYHIADIAAMTRMAEPPPGADRVWDFRVCTGPPSDWTPVNANVECTEQGLAFRPSTGDGHMTMSGLDLDLEGARWVRLAAAVQFPMVEQQGMLGEWFWSADGLSGWAQERSKRFYLAATREWHVYWTYLSAPGIGSRLDALRFDPLNDDRNARIGWIAVSTIPDP
ncbi:MAG TPA: hypothetical protein VFR15_04595 [Chloroflexia bacterium]|nr:hypothetical protein [Chloroflexia bacterium]